MFYTEVKCDQNWIFFPLTWDSPIITIIIIVIINNSISTNRIESYFNLDLGHILMSSKSDTCLSPADVTAV